MPQDKSRLSEEGSSIQVQVASRGGFYAYTAVTIHESMAAAKGSRILSKPGSSTTIDYRDASKPPIFDGKVTPIATLNLNPLISGEIDQGETCDDANTTPGAGCDQLCQLE